MTKEQYSNLKIGDAVFVLHEGTKPDKYIITENTRRTDRIIGAYHVVRSDLTRIYHESAFSTVEECYCANIADTERVIAEQTTYLAELKKAAAPLLGNDCL
jgi:hypothetical protein